MDSDVTVLEFTLSREADQEELKWFTALPEVEDGIDSCEISGINIVIGYYPWLITGELIWKWVKERGLLEAEKEKPKGVISRFIGRLAEHNSKEFGNKRLDCCDVTKEVNR